MAKSGACSEIVMVPDERVLAVHAAQAVREMPSIANMNVTNSSKIHVGPKFVSVNQTVQNKEMIKGQILGLELVSAESSRRLRCSVAVFLCWALLVSLCLAFYLFYITIFKQQVRLDIDLPLPKYVWSVMKNTTKAERLACLGAISAMIVFILLVVYYTVYAKNTTAEVVDVAPHSWNITREMWLAKDHHWNGTQDSFKPLKIVVIGHTVGNECYTFKQCAAEIRNLQRYLMTTYDYDIQFNFLVGNDGRIYEGLGWNREGAHTRSYNNCTLGVAFMGDYREDRKDLPVQSRHTRVTQKQLDNTLRMFSEGVNMGYLAPDFLVVGARDLSSSLAESPGDNLYNAIRQWDVYDHENRFHGRTCNSIYGIDKNDST